MTNVSTLGASPSTLYDHVETEAPVRLAGSVTTPHFHKCQGEPMKNAKNSQGFGKAMIIENLYAKKNYRKPRRQGEQRIAKILWKKPRSGHTAQKVSNINISQSAVNG